MLVRFLGVLGSKVYLDIHIGDIADNIALVVDDS